MLPNNMKLSQWESHGSAEGRKWLIHQMLLMNQCRFLLSQNCNVFFHHLIFQGGFVCFYNWFIICHYRITSSGATHNQKSRLFLCLIANALIFLSAFRRSYRCLSPHYVCIINCSCWNTYFFEKFIENTRERHWFDADFKWIITWFSKLSLSNFDIQSFFKPACPKW